MRAYIVTERIKLFSNGAEMGSRDFVYHYKHKSNAMKCLDEIRRDKNCHKTTELWLREDDDDYDDHIWLDDEYELSQNA